MNTIIIIALVTIASLIAAGYSRVRLVKSSSADGEWMETHASVWVYDPRRRWWGPTRLSMATWHYDDAARHAQRNMHDLRWYRKLLRLLARVPLLGRWLGVIAIAIAASIVLSNCCAAPRAITTSGDLWAGDEISAAVR